VPEEVGRPRSRSSPTGFSSPSLRSWQERDVAEHAGVAVSIIIHVAVAQGG